MIVITVAVQSDPDSIAALTDAIVKMEAASRAEEGCQEYTFSQELGDPSKLRIVEHWRSEADLIAHFAAPHMAEFQAAMAAHPPKSMDLSCFEATERAMPPMG